MSRMYGKMSRYHIKTFFWQENVTFWQQTQPDRLKTKRSFQFVFCLFFSKSTIYWAISLLGNTNVVLVRNILFCFLNSAK